MEPLESSDGHELDFYSPPSPWPKVQPEITDAEPEALGVAVDALAAAHAQLSLGLDPACHAQRPQLPCGLLEIGATLNGEADVHAGLITVLGLAK